MLLYLILLYLSRNATHAAPLSPFSRDDFDVAPPSDPSTCTCLDQRSIWDILWSCFATIFACSWVSVHPNIPGPDESRTKTALRRLELMFWAIVAPEMIIFWAIRQWIGARSLAQRWESKGWTKTHGYFMQMGGFVLYEGEVAKGVLSPEGLAELSFEGRIKFPTITEKEIQDRSKADALSKALVIGQTAWFMLQCLARAVQRLEITQLELLTVALAFLNAFMYIFWWNKPLDVQTAVPVYLLDEPLKETSLDVPLSGVTGAPAVASLSPTFQIQSADFAPKTLTSVDNDDESASPLLDISETTTHPSAPSWTQRLWTSFHGATRYIVRSVSSAIAGIKKLVDDEKCAGAIYAFLIDALWEILRSMLSRLREMADFLIESAIIRRGQMRVPTFYALYITPDDYTNVRQSICAIAMAFGAIHGVGWALTFPSATEAWIWRISSIAISITPLLVCVGSLFESWWRRAKVGSLMQKRVRELGEHVLYASLAMLPVYILARILLLIEAFIGLRALTPGALAVVTWTTFLPHI